MSFALPQDRPALMGILNVTPDSFSDGGLFFDPESAVEAAVRMVGEGADLIDVGGESTRPGSESVPEDEELRRVLPVVRELCARGIPVSIDTSKASVAHACLESGAAVVNDVTALSDPDMAAVCADAGCHLCLMHMQGTPRTMQADPRYGDVVEEVRAYLLERAAYAQSQGVAKENIWFDPGIGFGKTLEHNLELLRRLDRFVDSGYSVLIGVSRKSFLGRISDPERPLRTEQRLPGTLAAQTLAQANGARIIRAHDVRESRQAIGVVAALRKGSEPQ